jgi:hypothetical protein
MRRSSMLILAAAALTWASAAAADPISLNGRYAFTGTTACIQVPLGIGFNANLTPAGGNPNYYSFSVEGVRTFSSNGTGTVKGRSVSIDAPPFASGSSDEFTFQFTYTIAPDGVLSTSMVPGTYAATVLTGPRAGQTSVDTIPAQVGFIGEGASSIVLAEPAPILETHTFSNGDMFVRLCHRSRVLIKLPGNP